MRYAYTLSRCDDVYQTTTNRLLYTRCNLTANQLASRILHNSPTALMHDTITQRAGLQHLGDHYCTSTWCAQSSNTAYPRKSKHTRLNSLLMPLVQVSKITADKSDKHLKHSTTDRRFEHARPQLRVWTCVKVLALAQSPLPDQLPVRNFPVVSTS